MDSASAGVPLQGSLHHTAMKIDDPPPNGSLQNGSVSTPLINDLNDLSLPGSTPEESEKYPSSTENTLTPVGRKGWLPTGCCYDDRMKLHANADWSASPHHPEDPRRIEAIMKTLKDAGLIFNGSLSELSEILKISPTRWMWRVQAREATEAEICTAHTAAHYNWVRSLSKMSSDELRELTRKLDSGRKSLYVGSLTFQAALVSAGAAIEMCKNIVAGNLKNGLAVIRPPGHHAEHNEPLGFCVFNNVPIAVNVCMADYPETCRKVLILDWDVHHGNGIQNIFYENPNVLYISIHVYEGGTFYPGQPDDGDVPDGGPENPGAGIGVGRNVNIGWETQGMGDGDYMAAFQHVVMPIAHEFDPDLVVIAAGFDAAAGDELGGCWVTPECYSHMTHMLMSLANGKVAVCLEGGYNLSAISRSALAVAKTLMGEPPARMPLPPVSKSAQIVLDEVKQYQAPYWQCMRAVAAPIPERPTRGGIDIPDVIRGYQQHILGREFKMVNMHIVRDKVSTSFDGQVLVTPELHSAKKILLIIHDPPKYYLQLKYRDIDPSPKSSVDDDILPYIKWAISNGYGVMDINIPRYILAPGDDGPPDEFLPQTGSPDTPNIESMTKELLCYIWDNFLEGFETNCIAIMGVGNAYLGAKQLLVSRDSRHKIACVLSFVNGALRPVKSETDPHLSQWFKMHSLIYVAPDHACWTDPESTKKVRKNRFGGVRLSEFVGLKNMLKRYQNESCGWIEKEVSEKLSALGLYEEGDPEDETESEGGDAMVKDD